MSEKTRLPKQAYWAGALVGFAAVGIAYVLARHQATMLTHVLAGLSCLMICAWMLEGLHWHAEQARLRREREQTAVRDERLQQESAQAQRRVVQEINARRTVSHGGMTIEVKRSRKVAPDAQALAGFGAQAPSVESPSKNE